MCKQLNIIKILKYLIKNNKPIKFNQAYHHIMRKM